MKKIWKDVFSPDYLGLWVFIITAFLVGIIIEVANVIPPRNFLGLL